MMILQRAVETGASIEKIEALMLLSEKWETTQDKRRFQEAMVAFKNDPPKIYKDSHVKFKTEKGITEYDHASLGNVTELIGKGLAAVGISHKWTHEQGQGGISVTCWLSLGSYSESTTLTAPPDASGGKNTIQAIVSTKSYLERHTLTGITGMATNDVDDDGRGGKQDGMADELLAECLADVARAPNHDTLVQIFKDRYAGAQAAKDTAAQTKISEAKDKRKAELDAEAAEKAQFAEAMAECSDLESWNKTIVSLMKDNRRGWEKQMGAVEAKNRGYKADKKSGLFVEVAA
jgi:hypothetical protein